MGRVETNFKQNEVGLIPSDWEVHAFGDIVDYTKGFAFKSKDYRRDGIRIIRVSDTTFDTIKKENGIYVDEKDAANYKNWRLDEADLIFTTVGSKPPMYDSMVGKAIIVSKEFEGSFLNQNAVLIRAKKRTKEKQAILLSHFRMKRYLHYIELIYRGNANQASITLKELFEFKIPLPKDETEQNAIANALSDADSYIESLEKLIAKKQLIKQGAMQQLLSPKPHWEIKKIDKIAEVIGGGTPSTFVPQYWNGDINWFTPTEIGFHKYASESIRKITKDGASSCASKVLPIGTVLLTTRAGIGDASILLCESSTNQGFQSLVARDGYSNEYIYYLILTLKKVLLQRASGSTFLEISPNKIREIEVCMPPHDEQLRIAGTLSEMDLELEIINQKLTKSKNLKQGMMQQLLTGKIRLV
jgi:type I restriction enzyme S subunit